MPDAMTPPGQRSASADHAYKVQCNCNDSLAVAYEMIRVIRYRASPQHLDPRVSDDAVVLRRTLSHIGDIRHELDRLEQVCRPHAPEGA